MTKTSPILALLISLALSSCALIPPSADESELQRAAMLLDQGNRQQAAEIYWQQAQRSSPPQREELQLLALETVLSTETLYLAQQYRASLDETLFQGKLLVRKRIAEAQLALLENRPDAALSALSKDLDGLVPSRRNQLQELRAQALQASGQILQSATLRLDLDRQLKDPQAQQDNRKALWQALHTADIEQLQQWTQQSSHTTLRGWLELVYITKTSPESLPELEQMLKTWQQQFPDHPANLTAIPWVMQEWRDLQFHPHRIGIILPFTGKYASIAKAIMAGITTAFYTESGLASNGVVLQIYDMGDQPNNIQRLYAQAVDEGVEVIIGPLQKQALANLMQLTELPVPVLSLNYADNSTGPEKNLYQFGLLPEDEAKQLAERAILDEHHNVVVFAPSGAWGTRLVEAFAARFEGLGGVILQVERFEPEGIDFSASIKRALLLDESEQRYRILKETLNRKIKFQPHRRQDVDMVFVAANPPQARLIRPQFRFHYASDLPLYATSQIYSGNENPAADQDINGMVFCDMPWNLHELNPRPDLRMTIEELYSDSGHQLPRLAALGIDAYGLLPHLKRLAARPYEKYPGVTGILSQDNSRRFYRELNWARFTRGRPVAMSAPSGFEQGERALP
jgi:outer membrane PBP1 activator LpoA protein